MIGKLTKYLNNNSGFTRYLKNTSWLMTEKVVRMVIALSIGVWVTRYLGPDQFGVLSYAQSFVGIFAAFSSLGLNDIIIRELVKSKDQENVLMGSAFGLQTLGSTSIMLILSISILLNDNDQLTNKIIVILGLLTFVNSFNVITSYFHSVVKSKFYAITGLIGVMVSSIIKVYLILGEYSLIYFVYVLAFDVVFLALGLMWFYRRMGHSLFSWRFSWSVSRDLLKDAWPLVLSGIIISIYMKIDQVMIKEFMGNSDVGQYSAAVRLSEAWYFIPTIICSSLFPAIINAKMRNHDLYMSRLQRLYNLMVLLGVVIILPVVFLSDWLIHFLYGAEFHLSAGVLNIHILGSVFVFLGVANQKWFISENFQAYNIVCLGFGMMSNIILNIFLIPKYGIIGAAYATLISQFVASVLAPVLFKKTRNSFLMMVHAIFFVQVFKKGKLL
ncbi:Membrane protein involved in the export of O-antigen and teichoic acid [Flagellimonas pacifica]|uniref:Membrane protein involved in the export of O-antigen and teichoic acid n=1 Tax=Flagellimonas pacifica TaxID=1247520 RepID=A0A285MR16_9FLAO|nr:Membrane protein involved in the export of O-antigen and teichoic acid [Allomuricauda parva]